MKKLDWYIFRKLIVAYLFVVIILVLVICVIDWSEKNDDFVTSDATLQQILVDYFLNLAPYWASVLSPLMVFIACVFVTARLASHTEIIAMLSSGISFSRLIRPYILASSLIGLVNFVGSFEHPTPIITIKKTINRFIFLSIPHFTTKNNYQFCNKPTRSRAGIT